MATTASAVFESGRPDLLSGTPRAHAVDRWIYVGTVATFITITLAGFIPDSLEKMAAVSSGARPPFPLVMHLHAALMGSYLTLLFAQTWLAATGRIRWHMQLGILAAAIVPLLVIIGFMLVHTIYHETLTAAHTNEPHLHSKFAAMLARKENILLVQIRMGVLFPLFVTIGLLARITDAGLHKRMMMLATVVVLPPAIDRILWLPSTFPFSFATTELYMLLAIAPMFIWDTLRNSSIHKAYLIWLGFTLPFAIALYGLWDTPLWHGVAQRLLT